MLTVAIYISWTCYITSSVIIPVLLDKYPENVPDMTAIEGNVVNYEINGGILSTGGTINQHLGNNIKMLEEDIMLKKQQEEIWNRASDYSITFLNRPTTMGRYKRQAYHADNYFWQNGIVPYRFDSKLSEHAKRIIRKSMEKWESNTCITFVPASNKKNALAFVRGTSCSSYIGHMSHWTKQPVSIGHNCEHVGC
uniref:Astacin domain-containing protein n=1 Tax=Elaeophora elaphi TaxID=1147741 RepID=A0A0R3RMJ3_9BILA